MVTLGIIGVVSAMTVPSLMQNYQRQSYVTQLHKVYNELNQALIQYQTDKNAVNLTEAGLNSLPAFSEFFKKYFRIVQDCGDTPTPCFAAEYKKISGVKSHFSCTKNCFTLASGASIGNYLEIGNYGTNTIVAFDIDVNGPKGPNVIGRDAFYILLYKNGVLDDLFYDNTVVPPASKEKREEAFDTYCTSTNSSYWHGCFGKLLNDNWQMTYKKKEPLKALFLIIIYVLCFLNEVLSFVVMKLHLEHRS